jgi:uncharacterized protein (DUF362 family)
VSLTLTRRELARLAGLGLLAAPAASRRAPAAQRDGARVGLAPLDPSAVSAESARRAVEGALVAATGTASARAAARVLFRPGDTVGIKLNCLAGRGLSPRRELVEGLAALLREAGIGADRIIVFDRSSRELRRGGFTPGENRLYRCAGIDNDYDPEISVSGEIGSCFARLVSTTCTALVSFGVVKDHDLSGVSAGVKNWYGVIHNPNKYHDNNCDPYLADLLRHPYLKDKFRLTVLDGVTAQYQGGPAYRPDATWPLGVVAASADMLAADAWVWRVLDAERGRHGLPPLAQAKRAPRFLATAQRYGLGTGDPAAIHEVPA